MAKFYLINAISVGSVSYRPGTLVDDATPNGQAIIATGALVVPDSNTKVAQAAIRANFAHTNRGASDADLQTIMQSALENTQEESQLPDAGGGDIGKVVTVTGVNTYGLGTGGAGILVSDEGVDVPGSFTKVNVVGAGVTAVANITPGVVDFNIPGGGDVPSNRTITAGAGLTGGGDLSANRTIDAVANADGSIVVNANDIQVGILANDSQHGNRGGAALHAAVVASGAAGFMIGNDKTKLDGISASAAAVTSSAPANVTKSAAAVGTATDAARADHKHDISTAVVGNVGSANAEGTASSLARSDHTHNLPFTPVQTALAAATGDVSINSHKLTNLSPAVSSTDAVNLAQLNAASFTGTPKAPSKAVSTSNIASRTGLATTVDGVLLDTDGYRVLLTAQTTGSQNGWWVVHSGAWTRPTDFATGASATGAFGFIDPGGTTYANSSWWCDTEGAVVDTDSLAFIQFNGLADVVAGAGLTKTGNTLNVIPNADGSIVVNADDVQVGVLATDGQHGTRGGGTLHSNVVAAGAAGFMTGSDKTKLDGLPSSAVSPSRTLNAGTGMTGGGDLSADRTFNVIANADGSILANTDDIQVGVLATDGQHGVRGGGTTHAAVVAAGTNGFMTGSDKTKLDGLPTSAVPTSRNLTAGLGLTGGGDLTADRTFDVGANGDGSIAVNANDIQVGILATDAQHGNRGGAALHTNVVAAGAAGFMTGSDKTKLDGLPTSAVPTSRALTAGAGLTGGGDLSADRTFDVVANADGSLVVNANDVQVGVLATDGQHGVRGGGTLHSNVVAAGAAGFMTGSDKTKLDGLPTSAVPTTRNLTAGAGLTGGGDLSADRTFNAVANADGSLVVNADDIQVGVLATDGQHGVRGGGTQHAVVVAAGANGFMTGSDKTKLDGISALAAALTASAPVNVTKAAAAVGTATDAARADHKHDITTAVVSDIGTANAEGTASSLTRSDHTHNLPFTPVQTALGAATGDVSINAHKLTNVSPAVSSTDAVNLAQLNAASFGGAPKAPAVAVSISNIAALTGLTTTVDGVLLDTDGYRVLLTGQTTGSQNGWWVVHSGAWTRPTDFATGGTATGAFGFVNPGGTTYANSSWWCDTPAAVIDTTALVFIQFNGLADVIAGAGLTKTGNTMDVGANGDGSIVVNANDVQVGVLATDGQHGTRGGGTLHAAVVAAGANGFMTGSDKTKLDGLPTSAVPTSRNLTAGTGLTGGGDLSADRTFNVIANADGSIVVNADDIQVGILATDGQHGARGGGTQHANVVAAGAAGFMTGSDKTKLDGLPSSAVPTTRNLTAGAGLTGGGDLSADRTFDVVANADGSIVVNANDLQVGILATDAQHGNRGGGALHANVVAAGAAGFMTGSDKTKLDGIATGAAALTSSAPVNVTKAAAAVGTATDAARSDHKHDISTAIVGTISVGDAAAEGTATSLARSDHTHALTAPSAPVNVTKAAASAGSATTVARSDHKHDITTAVVSDIGTANAEGTATSLARSDHTHNLPASAVQTATAALASALSVNSQKITNLVTPTTGTDAANKTYVDLYASNSGNTASRPGSPITGQYYFDTTLTQPIWWSGANWVNAAGVTV